jgi:hypothetical protein
MLTEHLHLTLSPQTHAALLDGLQRQAMQDRRRAQRAFGREWPLQLWQRAKRLRFPLLPIHPQKA